MNGQDQLLDEIIQLRTQLRDMFFSHYMDRELFSPTWWLSIGLVVIPLAVWWRMVDRRRLLEICIFGLLANVAATFLDVIGTDFVLWEYPVHVFPQISLLMPVDHVIVPVTGMMLYQRFASWKAFILACAAASAFMSFVCEPFAAFLGMYRLLTWRYAYSFPIYILLYACAKLVVGRLLSSQAASRGRRDPPTE